MSSRESNCLVMAGMAVAKMVPSKAMRKTDRQSEMMIKTRRAPWGYFDTSSSSVPWSAGVEGASDASLSFPVDCLSGEREVDGLVELAMVVCRLSEALYCWMICPGWKRKKGGEYEKDRAYRH